MLKQANNIVLSFTLGGRTVQCSWAVGFTNDLGHPNVRGACNEVSSSNAALATPLPTTIPESRLPSWGSVALLYVLSLFLFPFCLSWASESSEAQFSSDIVKDHNFFSCVGTLSQVKFFT